MAARKEGRMNSSNNGAAMLKRFFCKPANVLSAWRRKPRLDSEFLQLLNSVITWKVDAEFCRREAEQNAIRAPSSSDHLAQDGSVAE
jgi:hypothetical protein